MQARMLLAGVLAAACTGPAVIADETGTTSASSASTTDGSCDIGTQGCVCTNGGACDPGLECVAGSCVNPDCAIGTLGCPCTEGGACDPGSVCNAGFCIDDDGGTSISATGMTSLDSTASSVSLDTSASSESADASATATGPDNDSSSGDTGEPVDLVDWTKRRPIQVDNSLQVDLVDHQVLITMPWDDDWEPTLDDLRFTDASGTVLLPHWVETYSGGLSVDVWVRVPQVDANDIATIYVYYSNPAATDTGDPNATFVLFEPFDGNALDANDWTSTGSYEVDNGRLRIDTGSVYSTAPLATLPGHLIEARASWIEGTGMSTGLAICEAQSGAQDTYCGGIHRFGGIIEAGMTDGEFFVVPTQNLNGVRLGTMAWVGVGANADYVQFEINRGLTDEDNTMAEIPGDFYILLGSEAGSIAGINDVQSIEYEHVIVRQFAITDPETFVGNEEDV